MNQGRRGVGNGLCVCVCERETWTKRRTTCGTKHSGLSFHYTCSTYTVKKIGRNLERFNNRYNDYRQIWKYCSKILTFLELEQENCLREGLAEAPENIENMCKYSKWCRVHICILIAPTSRAWLALRLSNMLCRQSASSAAQIKSWVQEKDMTLQAASSCAWVLSLLLSKRTLKFAGIALGHRVILMEEILHAVPCLNKLSFLLGPIVGF